MSETQQLVKSALSRGWIKVSEQPVLTKRGTPRKRNWWRGHPILTDEEVLARYGRRKN